MAQGKRLTDEQIAKICKCLAQTDMSLEEIAARFQTVKQNVSRINRERGIRIYAGLRNSWTVGAEQGARCSG